MIRLHQRIVATLIISLVFSAGLHAAIDEGQLRADDRTKDFLVYNPPEDYEFLVQQFIPPNYRNGSWMNRGYVYSYPYEMSPVHGGDLMPDYSNNSLAGFNSAPSGMDASWNLPVDHSP